jgi:nitrite reductase/ring-hydroxylating ferredoxin subunit
MTEATDGFVAVAAAADIPDGAMRCVAIERERVVIAHVGDDFYAFGDLCGHRNAPLSRGRLTGHIVECPLHFAQFDVRTGRPVDGPISTDVPSYAVKVEAGRILVKR